jgi:excisionase family DNA binding protein
MWFNASVEVNRKNLDADHLLTELADFHPAIGDSPRGWTSARISLQAETLRQATILALTVVGDATGAEPIACEVMTEAEFTAREGFVPMPELVGATEAAGMLGVTRQRVQQMATEGALPATKIGKSLVIPMDAVRAKLAQLHQETAGLGNDKVL